MRARLPVDVLVGWTLFVWVTRMNNIVQDDDLDGFAMVWRFGAAVLFVVLAVAVVVTRRWAPHRLAPVLGALVVWSVGWWLVRGGGIVLDDHELGFTVVHTILMVVSIGVAMWAWARRDG